MWDGIDAYHCSGDALARAWRRAFTTAGTGAATAGAAAPGEKEKDAADGLKLNEVAVGLKLNDVAAAGGVAPVAPPASSCADSQSAPGQSAILMRMCAERVGQGHV